MRRLDQARSTVLRRLRFCGVTRPPVLTVMLTLPSSQSLYAKEAANRLPRQSTAPTRIDR